MGASALLLDEFFASGDARFVTELQGCESPATLKSLGMKWAADRRPFARQALLEYLRGGVDRPGHRPLLKALYKAYETKGDDEVVAHFLVAFDGLGVRRVHTWFDYDTDTRTSVKVEELARRKDLIGRLPKEKGRSVTSLKWRHAGHDRFTVVTRRYLQRRAWRYFRRLARKEPLRYRSAMLVALKLYPDTALQTVAQLMDSWGLMSALYLGSKVLVRKPLGVEVAEGATLGALAPAPHAPEAWSDCLDDLLQLYLDARSQTVRTWTLAVLRRDYTPKLKGLPLSKVRRFLRHPSQEAQALGAELLRGVEGLDLLPLDEWMVLLELDNEAAMPIVCELVRKHVHPDRLTLEQCVKLARSSWAPVADLGLAWARAKRVAAGDLATLIELAGAKVAHVRAEASEWLTQLMLLNEGEDLWPHVRALLDDNRLEPRAAALALMAKDKRYGDKLELWQAMAESPWPDVRAALVRDLKEREGLLAPDALARLWATSLLAVSGGARARTRAMQQVAARIAARPEEAERLLGLLGFMLRSAMPGERRAALGQITRAAVASAPLRVLVAQRLPELALGSLEVAS